MQLSEQIHDRDTLASCGDIKQPTNTPLPSSPPPPLLHRHARLQIWWWCVFKFGHKERISHGRQLFNGIDKGLKTKHFNNCAGGGGGGDRFSGLIETDGKGGGLEGVERDTKSICVCVCVWVCLHLEMCVCLSVCVYTRRGMTEK